MSRTSLAQRSKKEEKKETREEKGIEVKYQQPTLLLQEEIQSFLFMKEKYTRAEKQHVGWEPGQNYCSVKDDFGVCVFPNGDRYIGEWKEGQIQGMGLYFFSGDPMDRVIYLGDFQSGRFNGTGKLARFQGEQGQMIYYGTWIQGKKSHLGTHYYPQGCYYFGNWNEDRKEGQGKLITPFAEFIGNWHMDQRHGQGSLSITYEGDWIQDQLPWGKVIYCDKQGYQLGTYQGELHQGKRHGKGTYFWHKGTFEGFFNHDNIHGEGVLRVGKTVLKGNFSEQLEGDVKGQLIYECGDIFEGILKIVDGKVLRSRGLYRFAGGDQAQGEFWDNPKGQLAGKFLYLWNNGETKQFT